MSDQMSMPCPRCKGSIAGPDEESLADAMLEHLQGEHGHQPPHDHVLARIRRHGRTA